MASTHSSGPDDLDFGATLRGFAAGQTVLKRYTLKRLIGRGGMGVVWLAEDNELDEEVALKFLPELLAADRSALEDLKREVRKARTLTHSGIVRIHDFVTDGSVAAIAMEYVSGRTLVDLRCDQPGQVFEVEKLEPIIRQLVSALDYAHHQAKVVHRDLKPANVMVTENGEVKVLDFGIAASISESSSRISNRGTSGTLSYMSPEQLMGKTPGPTDDWYALGATIYELLTGKPPFFRGDLFNLIRTEVPPSLAARREEFGVAGAVIPVAWEKTVEALLSKLAANRPASGEDVERFLRGDGPRGILRVTTTVMAKAPTSPQAAAGLRTIKIGKQWLLLAVVLLSLLLGGGYYLGVVVPARRAEVRASVQENLSKTVVALEAVDAEAKRVEERLRELSVREREERKFYTKGSEAIRSMKNVYQTWSLWITQFAEQHPAKPLVRAANGMLADGHESNAEATAKRAESVFESELKRLQVARAEKWAIPLVGSALSEGWLERLKEDDKEAIPIFKTYLTGQLDLLYVGAPTKDTAELLGLWAKIEGDQEARYKAWKGEWWRLQWMDDANKAKAQECFRLALALEFRRETDVTATALSLLGKEGISCRWEFFDVVGRFYESEGLLVQAKAWYLRAKAKYPVEAGAAEKRRLALVRVPVEIPVEPQSASFSVDGAAVYGRIKLPVGLHKIQVLASGYDPVLLSVEVIEQETQVLPAVRLERQYGSAKFSSTPSGVAFEVVQNGTIVMQGNASGLEQRLPTGDYTVIWTGTNRTPERQHLNIGKDEAVSAMVDFSGGGLDVAAGSELAEIAVTKNGAELGRQKKRLALSDLEWGKYEVSVTQEGFIPVNQSAEIVRGKVTSLSISLVPDPSYAKSFAVFTRYVGTPFTSKQPDLITTWMFYLSGSKISMKIHQKKITRKGGLIGGIGALISDPVGVFMDDPNPEMDFGPFEFSHFGIDATGKATAEYLAGDKVMVASLSDSGYLQTSAKKPAN